MTEPDERTAYVWLQDLADALDPAWPPERQGRAARHLGRFNGAYLAGEPLPDHPALCANWLRSEVARAEGYGSPLPPPELWEQPAVRACVPAGTGERLAALWADCYALLDAADRVPRTFCHRDFFQNNLFSRRLPDGKDQMVAIDWALAGPGPVGEDAFRMAWVTGYTRASDLGIRTLDGLVFEHYVAGLRDAGWHGDPRLVRLGYAVWAIAAPVIAQTFLSLVTNADQTPPERIAVRAEGLLYLLDLADEARALMPLL